MNRSISGAWLPAFFALAACSFVPHAACHYYRLETRSSFVVGSWEYTPTESVVAIAIYAIAIGLDIAAVSVPALRFWAATLTGLLHTAIGALHVVRLVRPFRFEVFGHAWPTDASAREAVFVLGFGALCLWVAIRLARRRS